MRAVLLTWLCFMGMITLGQSSGFAWPLDSPCTITGNYGELRPNHFHAGIDFSTGGKVNRKVYAVMSGYISRIRISASGYGRCVYLTHPNGLVTVYAHLNNLNLKLAEAVKAEQNSRQSYEVELLPAPGTYTLRQGEMIGLSGNSGGSTGPHLHFEIRDEKSETPLNPLLYYRVKDKIDPVIEALGFYDLSDTLAPVLVRTAKIHPATIAQSFVLEKNIVGFAFMGFDRNIPNGNKNNVHKASLFLDGKLIYAHTLKAIDFSDGRYVNEFSETKGKIRLQRCFLPTLFPSRLYDSSINKGVVVFTDTLDHQLRLVLTDEFGNESERTFKVKSRGTGEFKAPPTQSGTFVSCEKDFYWQEDGFKLLIPAATLYRSTELKIENNLARTSRLVIAPQINLKSAIVIACKVPPAYAEVPDKLVLRSVGGSVPAITRNDTLYFYCKNTGTFTLMADLAAPLIRTRLSARRISRIKHFTSFSFSLFDQISGVSKYSVTVNGRWVIAELDAKSGTLTYTFDEDTPRGPLHFVVEAEDRVGNKRSFTYKLTKR